MTLLRSVRCCIRVLGCIVAAWAAGAGFHPALASPCHPTVQGSVLAEGDGVWVYASALDVLLDATTKGDSSHWAAAATNTLVEKLQAHVPEKTIYTVQWDGGFHTGCDWEDAAALSVVRYHSLDGVFSFSHGLFHFLKGGLLPDDLNFTMAMRMDERRGFRFEMRNLSLDGFRRDDATSTPRLRAGFSIDAWELVNTMRNSIVYSSIAGDKFRMTESTYRPPHPGDLPVLKTPGFRGGGLALGAELTWLPVPGAMLTYAVDDLLAEQWMKGLVHETYTLETHQQFVGIDGYLENRPLAKGMSRVLSLTESIPPKHRLKAVLGVGAPLRLEMALDPKERDVTDLSLILQRRVWSGELTLGWQAMDGSVLAALSYPLSLGPMSLHLDVSGRLDHVDLRQAKVMGIAGGAVLRF